MSRLKVPDAARLEALFASIGEGAIATDEHGIIIRVNQVALDILGNAKSDLMGKRFPDAVVALYDNGKPMDIFERPITRAFLTGKTVSERSAYRHKEGRMLPVFITVSPILLKGRPIGAIEVFRDLTSEIEQEKLKSDFISIASHQLRTPLSAIHIYTRMLREGMGGELSHQQQTYANTILLSVKRMNELIDTLLNITRIEAGSLIVREQTVQPEELVEQIVTEFIPQAKAKQTKIQTTMETDLPCLQSDPLLIKEILSNLISNAIKYTPSSGRINIKVFRKDNDVMFSVKDDGYGIPQHNQKYIFTKFFRADNITVQDVSGTGLGLYLTKIIIDKLGGDIWFKSKEGKGTEFCFSLKRQGGTS